MSSSRSPVSLQVTSQGCDSTASGAQAFSHCVSISIRPGEVPRPGGLESHLKHFAQRPLSLEDPATLRCPGLLGRGADFSQQFLLALLLGSVNLAGNAGSSLSRCDDAGQLGSGKPPLWGLQGLQDESCPRGLGEGTGWIYIAGFRISLKRPTSVTTRSQVLLSF